MREKDTTKLVTVILCIILLLPAFTFGQDFSDIQGHWAEGDIISWVNRGLGNGYSDNTFKPNDNITRAEFVTFINKVTNPTIGETEVLYEDLNISDWFYNDIIKATENGYILGYSDKKIRPNQNISRQEAAVIISRLLKMDKPLNDELLDKYIDKSSVEDWSKDFVSSVVESGFMRGYPDNTIRGTAPITRAETIEMLNKVFGVLYNQKGTYGPQEGTEVISGNVTVSTSDIKLQNLEIGGNLYLAEGIGEGEVYIENCTISGRTIIKGGGKESVYFVNSSSESVIIYKVNNQIRIVAKGDTNFGKTTVSSGGKLEEENLTGEGFKEVEVLGVLEAGTALTLDGNFENISVEEQINIEVTGDTEIGTLTVDKNAEGTNIKIEENASIGKMTLNTGVEVSGKGEIGEANINADNVKIEQKVENVNVSNEVDSVVVGGEEIGKSTDKDKKSPSSGGGGGGTGGNSGGGSTNNAPVAMDDTADGNEDNEIVIDVLTNDSDEDGDTLSIKTVSDAVYGEVEITTDNKIKYVPEADWNGENSFTYTVTDGSEESNEATVIVTVNPVNDVPVAVDDTVEGKEDNEIVIDVLTNDSDEDGDILSIKTVSDAVYGKVEITPDNKIKYIPEADWNGEDSFEYIVTDGKGGEVAGTVNVTVNKEQNKLEYGYIIQTTEISAFYPRSLIKIMNKEGEIIYDCADEVNLNGVEVDESDKLIIGENGISEQDDGLYDELVKYALNDEGEICKIITSDSLNLILEDSDLESGFTYDIATQKMGSEFKVDEETIIFFIDKYNIDECAVYDIEDLKDGAQYKASLYDSSNTNKLKAVVVRDTEFITDIIDEDDDSGYISPLEYGYIIQTTKNSGFYPRSRIKMVNEEGEIVILDFADKVNLNGVEVDEDDEEIIGENDYSGPNGGLYEELIKYALNNEGEICKIITSDSLNLILEDSDLENGFTYDIATQKMGSEFKVDEETIIFFIDIYNINECAVYDVEDLKDGAQYKALLYDPSNTNKLKAVVVRDIEFITDEDDDSGDISSLEYGYIMQTANANEYFIINSRIKMVNEEGEVVILDFADEVNLNGVEVDEDDEKIIGENNYSGPDGGLYEELVKYAINADGEVYKIITPDSYDLDLEDSNLEDGFTYNTYTKKLDSYRVDEETIIFFIDADEPEKHTVYTVDDLEHDAQYKALLYDASNIRRLKAIVVKDDVFHLHIPDEIVAKNDYIPVRGQLSVVFNVLDNDEDPQGDEFDITSVTDAVYGEIQELGSGNFKYIPCEDWPGEDSIEYTIEDGDGNEDTATVIFYYPMEIALVQNVIDVFNEEGETIDKLIGYIEGSYSSYSSEVGVNIDADSGDIIEIAYNSEGEIDAWNSLFDISEDVTHTVYDKDENTIVIWSQTEDLEKVYVLSETIYVYEYDEADNQVSVSSMDRIKTREQTEINASQVYIHLDRQYLVDLILIVLEER